MVEVGAVLGLVTNGDIETQKTKTTKQKQTIEKTAEINQISPELFDNNVVKLEKSPVSIKNEEQPLVLSNEIATESKVIKNQLEKSNLHIKSPVEGIVLNLPTVTVGSLLNKGESIVTLVRTGLPLVLEIDIDPKDASDVFTGDPVSIKVEIGKSVV